ncbi:hypothetical protein CDV31_013448 [Fusarium ambrosium]|uniref:Uncharacterized protein n=1 Tax=Fusarium ambrosium TaxID=131363 RepID=A0A428T373_9HYPO|nr:hypothetical protein CDV31_013448 [Fusarium ambrosium]
MLAIDQVQARFPVPSAGQDQIFSNNTARSQVVAGCSESISGYDLQALYVLGLTSGSYEAIQSISAVINYEGLLHWVQSRPDIQLYGDTYSDRSFKVPVISFQVSRRSPANSVGQIWAKTNCTSTADSYWARSLLEDVMCMDIDDGLIQSPFVHYSTIDEAQ